MILGLSRRHFLNGEGLKESDPILCTDMPLRSSVVVAVGFATGECGWK